MAHSGEKQNSTENVDTDNIQNTLNISHSGGESENVPSIHTAKNNSEDNSGWENNP